MDGYNAEADADRLASKTAGANVVDLLAYKQASEAASAASIGATYTSPRAMALFLILAFAFVVFFFLPRR